jgi:hypothetical protein
MVLKIELCWRDLCDVCPIEWTSDGQSSEVYSDERGSHCGRGSKRGEALYTDSVRRGNLIVCNNPPQSSLATNHEDDQFVDLF